MSKLTRIAEVGDGSYEQMISKNASVQENPLQSAKNRKKRFMQTSAKQPLVNSQNNWEELKSALRVSQKPFDPENYSSYDTSGKSVRRYEMIDEEYETAFDPTTRTAMTMHMYSDPMQEIQEFLKESALKDAMERESSLTHEIKQLQKAQQWDEEANAWAQARLISRNNEKISGSAIKGAIIKTSNENVIASNFGQLDTDALQNREMQKHQMIENMKQRHKSIKDSRVNITKEQRQSQWENDENIRSVSIQEKMKNSQLFNKLSQLTEA